MKENPANNWPIFVVASSETMYYQIGRQFRFYQLIDYNGEGQKAIIVITEIRKNLTLYLPLNSLYRTSWPMLSKSGENNERTNHSNPE